VRLTIHREAVNIVKYLSGVRCFVTFCAENNLKIWRQNIKNRKAQIIHEYKLNKVVERIVELSIEGSSQIERFLVVFTTGESELFEFSNEDDSLYWIESEKAREHEVQLAGCDYNMNLRILVTADKKGIIRIWNRDKKFLREI
jgi:hypothetical protein